MKKQGESSISEVVVIVVDDDLAVRNSLKFSLEIEGFTVRGYATGDELLNAGDLTSCNCLVVDQKMPGLRLSGLDLIAKLRARHIAAPAILITSHPSLSLRQRADNDNALIVEKPLLGNAFQVREDPLLVICRFGRHERHAHGTMNEGVHRAPAQAFPPIPPL